ncbi:MAG: hypothetical protein AB7O52_12115 [Planctomycetota bacterium]
MSRWQRALTPGSRLTPLRRAIAWGLALAWTFGGNGCATPRDATGEPQPVRLTDLHPDPPPNRMDWEFYDNLGVGGPVAATTPASSSRDPADTNPGSLAGEPLEKISPVSVTRGVPEPPTASSSSASPSSAGLVQVSRGNPEASEGRSGSAPSGPTTEGDQLIAMRDRLLEQLRRLQDRSEHELTDAQRLTKHDLETRLMSFHFLIRKADGAALQTLLESVETPVSPGMVHSLLRAALYHDVGSENLRDRVIASLRAGSADRPFALVSTEICTSVTHDGGRTRYPEYVFKPNQRILLFGELLNLSSRPDGDAFVSELEIEVLLLDAGGRQRDRRRLGLDGSMVDRQRVPREKNFFSEYYQLPYRLTPGSFRLVIIATDRNAASGATAQQELSIRIQN